MGRMRLRIDEARADRKGPRFAPAGQSTQVIIGADASTDRDILGMSTNLYGSYGLKRVYYSAFSPIPDASAALPAGPRAAGPRAPAVSGGLADALLRLRGARATKPTQTGNLDLDDRPQALLGAWRTAISFRST